MGEPIPVERWLPVAGYEGFYEVSDLGRVRSLDRWVRQGRWPGRSLRKGRVLRPVVWSPSAHYPAVTLSGERGQRQRKRTVHELVLEAFRGPRPEPPPGVYRMEARHLDSDPANNALSNLAWGTMNENRQDTIRMGRHGRRAKPYCSKGHPMSGANLHIRRHPDGTFKQRVCRTCDGWGGLDQTSLSLKSS
jgi:hypothetical protein